MGVWIFVVDDLFGFGGSPSATAPALLYLLHPCSRIGHPPYATERDFVMPDYRRLRVPGGTYFFTVNLLERKQDLLVRHIDDLRVAVRATKRQRPFHIDAWMVLSDHMHFVWTLPLDDADTATRWQLIKLLLLNKGLLESIRLITMVRKKRKEGGI